MQRILISLLDPHNIDTKTEIEMPMPLAQLMTMGEVLNDQGVPEAKKSIGILVEKYLVYMVSHNRQGRKEIIQALTEGLKEERKLREKLTSNAEGV